MTAIPTAEQQRAAFEELMSRKWYIVTDRTHSRYGPSIYNLYGTKERAEADLPRIVAERAGRDGFVNPRVMHATEYDAAVRDYFTSRPLASLNDRQFDYLLNVLPPKMWERGEGFSRFIMSEACTDSYHDQVISLRIDGELRHFIKIVDRRDRTTWPTEVAIRAAVAAGTVEPTTDYLWLADGAEGDDD